MNNLLTFLSTTLVALISVGGAWLSQRAAAKASTTNTKITAEADAYDRARKMDIATIERQDKEFEELHEENITLKSEIRSLRVSNAELLEENVDLRRRVARLERQIGDVSE